MEVDTPRSQRRFLAEDTSIDSDSVESGITTTTAQDEETNRPRDWITKEERARRTAALLFIGTLLAIIGLLLSLVMLLFDVACSTQYKLGGYVNRTGTFEMCREVPTAKEVRPGNRRRVDIMTVNVPYRTCRTDSSCASLDNGFCAGGEKGLWVPDYCLDHYCTCKSALPDCGLHTYFLWRFKAIDLIPDCRYTGCTKNRTLKVPYYIFAVGFAGCHYRRRTTVFDVQLWAQHDLEDDEVLEPVTSNEHSFEGATWQHLEDILAKTPEVRFGHFWPSTISESVSDKFSPAGRIFFGFMLCSGLCLLSSEYCTECITVDLPKKRIPFLGVQWNVLRMWAPPLGLILLSTVQMVPNSEIVDLPTALMTIIHLIGAHFCFSVYLFCEAAALIDTHNVSEMLPNEWRFRTAILSMGTVSMVTFGLTYGVLFFCSGTEQTPYTIFRRGGFSDLYKRSSALEGPEEGVVLLRPAEGMWKALKVVSYMAEYIVALSIVVSHLIIWFYFEWHRKAQEKFQKNRAD